MPTASPTDSPPLCGRRGAGAGAARGQRAWLCRPPCRGGAQRPGPSPLTCRWAALPASPQISPSPWKQGTLRKTETRATKMEKAGNPSPGSLSLSLGTVSRGGEAGCHVSPDVVVLCFWRIFVPWYCKCPTSSDHLGAHFKDSISNKHTAARGCSPGIRRGARPAPTGAPVFLVNFNN